MKGSWSGQTTRTVDLGYDQMLVLESKPGVRVRVLCGNMWLTEEGSAQDVFAGSGAEVALRMRGRAIVEPMGMARVMVIEPGPRAAVRRMQRRLAQHWSTVARQVRGAAERLLHA